VAACVATTLALFVGDSARTWRANPPREPAAYAWHKVHTVVRTLMMLCAMCCCLHVRSPVDVSSKKSALKLGTVEAKTKAKPHAKLVQERRPRTDHTPTPLAREHSNVAFASQPLAAPPGEINFEKLPEQIKANTKKKHLQLQKEKSPIFPP